MKAVTKKQSKVDEIAKEFAGASSIYLVNFEKLTVGKDNALRMNLRKKGVRYRAVKNTLLVRVLEKLGIKGLEKYAVGATGVMIAPPDDPMLPAREIVEFQKTNPDLLGVKVIDLEGEILQGSELDTVAKMPTRTGLLANIVMMILGPGGRVAGAVKALEEKLEKAVG